MKQLAEEEKRARRYGSGSWFRCVADSFSRARRACPAWSDRAAGASAEAGEAVAAAAETGASEPAGDGVVTQDEVLATSAVGLYTRHTTPEDRVIKASETFRSRSLSIDP